LSEPTECPFFKRGRENLAPYLLEYMAFKQYGGELFEGDFRKGLMKLSEEIQKRNQVSQEYKLF